MIIIFDIYKIGIGPSSSHTFGPMNASNLFISDLNAKKLINKVDQIKVNVYGSLSLTGKGHLTDIAILLGLMDEEPETIDTDNINNLFDEILKSKKLNLAKQNLIDFDFEKDFIFNDKNLPLHENGMQIQALSNNKIIYSKVYYSIGGGFIVEENFNQNSNNKTNEPYPINKAKDLLNHCYDNNLSISEIVMQNELSQHNKEFIDNQMAKIWDVIKDSIERGLKNTEVLPGSLKIKRRANELYNQLQQNSVNDPMLIIDWVNVFAFAVSEENAAGGRVVTAPTNGASGIIPAVLAYYDRFIQPITPDDYAKFFLTSGIIGALFKQNASISGAEVGCQGEVGVACSMAAAGLTALMDGTPDQICIAAEIGMEHNLGLTCDPVAGQVQIPCIERNGIGAIKAINASRMALRRTTNAVVSLDDIIITMLETGKDMDIKYRETSQGGLAIKILC